MVYSNDELIILFNIEYEKAKVFFEKALEYDPSLFGPHVVLAGLSPEGSEKSLMHIEKAKESTMCLRSCSFIFCGYSTFNKPLRIRTSRY